jgi:hypothetical protein
VSHAVQRVHAAGDAGARPQPEKSTIEGLRRGCPIFLTKMGKIYHIITKCNKRPLNLPIGNKTYQIAIKYTNIFQYVQDPPKFTQNGIFGLKMNHLATPV